VYVGGWFGVCLGGWVDRVTRGVWSYFLLSPGLDAVVAAASGDSACPKPSFSYWLPVA